MALPTKKRTKSSKKRRASHFALPKITLTLCSRCKKSFLPHRVCPFCGTYKGREVIKIETGKEREARKASKS